MCVTAGLQRQDYPGTMSKVSSESAPSDDASMQFLGKDKMGLMPEDKKKPESQIRQQYFKQNSFGLFVTSPIMCLALYLAVTYAFPSESARIQEKMLLVRKYDLSVVFVGYYLIFLARAYVQINSNGARAAARVDRPDQHVYQIMAESGPLSGAPYVLMTNVGAIGRFNRAQRACFNIDESLPLFMVGFMMYAVILGKMSLLIAAMYGYGAASFGDAYKESMEHRRPRFGIVKFATYFNATFVILIPFLAYLPAYLQ